MTFEKFFYSFFISIPGFNLVFGMSMVLQQFITTRILLFAQREVHTIPTLAQSVVVVKHLKSRTINHFAPTQDDNTVRKRNKLQYKTQKSFLRKILQR